jgi:trans-2,3-dihydro-3-hydroxyanthranilate isomerase
VLRYHLLDVFTDQIFGGNPLAVFPEAPPLEPALMQRLAGEMGLSETVFVTADARGPARHRLRIFTPRMELPFAGHPTVGTAVLLSELGLAPVAPAEGQASFTLETAVGLVPVTVDRRGGVGHAQLSLPNVPRVGPEPPVRADLAAMIGVAPDDLAAEPWRPLAASGGVPYLFIPVRDLAVLGRVQMDLGRWRALLAGWWAPHVYVICRVGERQIRARMFAPAMGIAEDPATGAAAVALPAYLAATASVQPGVHAWTIEQGIEMGRPSRMDLRFEATADGVRKVQLGGSAVVTGNGGLRVLPLATKEATP